MEKTKINRLIKLLILLIVISSLFSSCKHVKMEPARLALIESYLYDYDGENYIVTMEVFKPTSAASSISADIGNNTESIVATGTGRTFRQARLNTTNSMDGLIFSQHAKVRFLTQSAADKTLNIIDDATRNMEERQTTLLIIIKSDSPDKLYQAKTGLSKTVGEYIENITNSQDRVRSSSVSVDVLDFVKAYYSKGRQPVIGVVELIEDQQDDSSQENANQEYLIKHAGLAAYKNGKVVGYLDEDETLFYNMLENNLHKSNIDINTIGTMERILLEVKGNKSTVKVEFKDNNWIINVTINTRFAVVHYDGKEDLNYKDNIKKLEKDINKDLGGKVLNTIKKAQNEFKSDIFGFGERAYIDHPKEWKKYAADWDLAFEKATINVNFISSIYHIGENEYPITEEAK